MKDYKENYKILIETDDEILYKTKYGYWISHKEYEDEARIVWFDGGGCSISEEIMQKIQADERKKTLEEVIQKVRKLLVFEGILSFSVEKAFEELYQEELSKITKRGK